MKLKHHLLLCCSTIFAIVDAAYIRNNMGGNWTDIADTELIDNRWRLVLPYVIKPKFSDESARFWESRSPDGKPASAEDWIKKIRPEVEKAAKFYEPTNVAFKEYFQADIDSGRFAGKQYIVISDFYNRWSGCASDFGPSKYSDHVEIDVEMCRETDVEGAIPTPGAYQPGRIAKQLMHVMGFINEHQRSDRDRFVTVTLPHYQSDNYIKGDRHEGKILTPYDFESITHFGFSRYMQPKTGYPMSVLAGQRDYLSELDIQQININYPIKF